MILTFKLELENVKMNQRAKYLGQRSFSSKVIVRTPGHTNIRRTDCSAWTTKPL